jgi:hypothetical protein
MEKTGPFKRVLRKLMLDGRGRGFFLKKCHLICGHVKLRGAREKDSKDLRQSNVTGKERVPV